MHSPDTISMFKQIGNKVRGGVWSDFILFRQLLPYIVWN